MEKGGELRVAHIRYLNLHVLIVIPMRPKRVSTELINYTATTGFYMNKQEKIRHRQLTK